VTGLLSEGEVRLEGFHVQAWRCRGGNLLLEELLDLESLDRLKCRGRADKGDEPSEPRKRLRRRYRPEIL